jgi:hypothetical protein
MPLIILRKTCLSHVIEYEADGCYLANWKMLSLQPQSRSTEQTESEHASWGVNCSHSVSSRNYRSTWMKNRPWSNGIWIKHHSGSSQSCHTLLPSSLRRLQQCDEGFWERVNEHSVNRWLRGQI